MPVGRGQDALSGGLTPSIGKGTRGKPQVLNLIFHFKSAKCSNKKNTDRKNKQN